MSHVCESYVDAYLQRYGWQLIDRDELIRLVVSALHDRTDLSAAAVRAAILCVYSVTLYQACSGTEGRDRLEQAYVELHSFLDNIARYRYPTIRAEATQRALEQIYLKYSRCRRPQTFLAFVLQKLRDAARAELRLAQSGSIYWSNESADDGGVEAIEQPGLTPDLADVAAFHDFQQQMVECSAAFLQLHPGAAHQFAALWLKYIKGLSDETISRRLGRSVGAVHVLRARAVQRLRQEPSWQLLACELGLCSATTQS